MWKNSSGCQTADAEASPAVHLFTTPRGGVMENKMGKRDVNHVSLCSHLLATTHTSQGPAAVVSGPGLGPAVVPGLPLHCCIFGAVHVNVFMRHD